MIPSKILAPILAAVAFVAGAAVALPSIVAGDEPVPRREPLLLEGVAQTPEPRPTLTPKPQGPREGRGGDDRPGQGPRGAGDDDGNDPDDVSDSGGDDEDDDDDGVEVIRPQPDDDDDDEADDDGDDGDGD